MPPCRLRRIIFGNLATKWCILKYISTIQYNIRLLEAVRTQRRTIIEREKYVENENVKMVARSGPVTSMCLCTTYA